jgi:hypothetical protein
MLLALLLGLVSAGHPASEPGYDSTIKGII